MKTENLQAYSCLIQKELPDVYSKAYLLTHDKSGAQLLVLENTDENKVFNIGFRTPAPDSTGVPHIMEHSVLCGSRKFPAKDPFVELAKGSLNTFLNAITYPDHTMYPVASLNDKDFQNLMDIYLDAVFYPNIYKREEIFRQEGWSYQLESEKDSLKYNGVVYNEMKGAFSSPDEVLNREILASLYPDISYANESGGNPENIPDLTYEQFLEFHKTYYHPSNSYIYLYGNMNMEEKLEWLDKEYLSHFEKKNVESAIGEQKPFENKKDILRFYSISEGETEENNAYLSYNVSLGANIKKEISLAFEILEYVLIAAPGAPIKKALIDSGIGEDVYGGFDDSLKYSYLSVVAKKTEADKKEEFLTIIQKTLQSLVEAGISREALESAINYLEFRYREADYGRYPKGLMYGLKAYASWLYDEKNPFMYLEMSEVFDLMRQKIGTGYFEELIQSYILSNIHATVVVVKPVKGLDRVKEEELSQKLEQYKNSLSHEEIEELIQKTNALRTYQDIPSTKEELETIPLLKREDIKRQAEPFYLTEKTEADIKLLHHNLATNEIGYVTLLFDAKALPALYIPYLGLLKNILGFVDTENYSYSDLFHKVNRFTGGIHASSSVYGDCQDSHKARIVLELHGKAFYPKQEFLLQMMEEILVRSNFQDTKRLYEILAELKSRLQMMISSSGHSMASIRGLSYFSYTEYYTDLTMGIGFYQFVEELVQNFESRKEELVKNLYYTMNLIVTRKNLTVSYTGDDKGYSQITKLVSKLGGSLYQDSTEQIRIEPILERKNEGFKIASQVQYVARVGNYIEQGFQYTGLLKVLNIIMNYEYLWQNIRLKGGAYGCMSGFSRNGDSYFVSYRDPHLKATNEIFEKIPDYVESFTVDDRDMTKYVIGTISGIDTPLTPKGKGERSLAAYMMGLTYEMLQKERDEILQADQSQIRQLAPLLRAVVSGHYLCAVGNEKKIDSSDIFLRKINLFQ